MKVSDIISVPVKAIETFSGMPSKSMLEAMEALSEDAKQSTLEKRFERRNSPMMQGVKDMYDLVQESFDAYLDSLTVDKLLNCVEDGKNADSLLADAFQEEADRLKS